MKDELMKMRIEMFEIQSQNKEMQTTLIEANETINALQIERRDKKKELDDIEKKCNDVIIKLREAENKIYSLRREVDLKEEDLESKQKEIDYL